MVAPDNVKLGAHVSALGIFIVYFQLSIKLTGRLNGWASPKDVVLHLVGKLTVNGGTGHIFEYFGEGVESLSCTGMATICNMGAEMGATTSVFPYTPSMHDYLVATGREQVATQADAFQNELLRADEGCEQAQVYDRVVEIDLSSLEPHINGPFSPDRSFPLSEFAKAVKENNWPTELKSALIGSCTNSSYEDITKAADIANQAKAAGLSAKSELLITPGSTMIEKTIARDGLTQSLTDIGGMVLANACGPCIGQWKRHLDDENEPNAIITSFNRNFVKRNDGNPKTLNFLAAPEVTVAMSFAGTTTFNPVTDNIPGTDFKFSPPKSKTLPSRGFSFYSQDIFQRPNPDANADVNVSPSSERLQLLEPFDAWNGEDFKDMLVSVKVQGKCTTDHISAAGPWLKYKGHLENIAENTLIGAVNDENDKVNNVHNSLTGEFDTIPEVMKAYKDAKKQWMVLADHNYGEGSAREHAAMQVRYLGGSVVVARSFARIHETNLKKQGVLPLWLQDENDYSKISPRAVCSTDGLSSIAPGSKVDLLVRNPGQDTIRIPLRHTLSGDQIEWIRAGSALNMIAAAQAREEAASA
ncbi:aconitate hydratase, mitochondrial [Sphaeroforma arctica JP610]|uniref:Aconitate hydratase, mitochondrial n=1 Tax=Sphaeroforma arctica JP610 TaxID=667725 RepID=A0A0L0G9J6_9EUKA|nr:aconitate hydratase, mitochondrial [Sphaeroforma arctica JP610]KNC85670.1 aconitate hydratase, mitochondrial [Sphaeroforma arctica JP610]|eukprot:XP_014159572.1 aconitate hydratase, mitochondrial [Sphaeroforma arctica JP610]